MTGTSTLPPTLAAIVEDRHAIVKVVNALVEDRAAMAKRIADLEASSLRYAGTWKADVSYGVNALVTHSGATWLSLRSTSPGDRPGSNGGAWLLTAKSHR